MNDTDQHIEALDAPHPETTFPWPPAPGASVIDAFASTWKQVCFEPATFFRRMPREDYFGAVIAYYLVIGVAVAGIHLFWSSILGNIGFISALFPEDESRFGPVVEFLFSPIILLITLYIVTGVCHLVLMLARGARHGFETSTRVFAFSYSPAILAAIPFLGNIVAFFWMTWLAITGLREAHQTDGAKAAIAVLVPLFLLLCTMALVFIGAMFMGILDTPI